MAFIEKNMRPLAPIVVGGRPYKRYHVDRPERPIEPEVEKAAYEFLPKLVPAPADDSPAGWIVLHRGGDTGAYLLVYTWAWDNVVEVHTAAAGQPAVGCPDEDPANFVPETRRWAGCVWELPALEYERSAWVRHMFVKDDPDLDGYLADARPEGPVGR
ncbi:hypothetical protein GCM10010156_46860 [Planobispora rosea]|uniref:Uncharacterized protein n=1 Tax=Planobispora rosea TaxID=35762 RepID=A0A8J3WBS2_PLARO|nr:hypothetical protein [Planobispora rosea]GGS82813.1 hypothetical protein GCM10010156_46860 [Planobispora rosea]GIH84199.1 hypothetical protein Pro02_26070 [Planobispora rosea]